MLPDGTLAGPKISFAEPSILKEAKVLLQRLIIFVWGLRRAIFPGLVRDSPKGRQLHMLGELGWRARSSWYRFRDGEHDDGQKRTVKEAGVFSDRLARTGGWKLPLPTV